MSRQKTAMISMLIQFVFFLVVLPGCESVSGASGESSPGGNDSAVRFIAIENVTVIDAVGPRREGYRVVTQGDRIIEVAPMAESRTPVGAAVVDGTDRFLIPGL